MKVSLQPVQLGVDGADEASAIAGNVTRLNPRLEQGFTTSLARERIACPFQCGDSVSGLPGETGHLQEFPA